MSRENVELVRRVVDPWGEGDFSAWIELFAEDVVLTAYMPEGVVPYDGRSAVLAYLAEFASQWREYRVVVENVASVSQDAVLVTGRQTGIGRGSGAEIAEPVSVVNVLRGEEIVSSHWHVDRKGALEAVGLAE